MKKLLSFFAIVICLKTAHAARVDTVDVPSARMNKEIKAVVISPEHTKATHVLYLLHGYSGKYSDWVRRAPRLAELVDAYGFMVVCPDGGYDSWYWDTEQADYQYETFITRELLPYIERSYGVGSDRFNRGITGLSMGGHGALYLAFRHQDLFAFAGSTSGGVDIRPFPNNWNIKQRIGSYHDHPNAWNEHTVMGLIHLIQPGDLQLFIDCGTDDFFFDVNNRLHEQLTYHNIPHHYLTMPGKHDWNYWSRSIDFQMAFFNQCFQRTEATK